MRQISIIYAFIHLHCAYPNHGKVSSCSDCYMTDFLEFDTLVNTPECAACAEQGTEGLSPATLEGDCYCRRTLAAQHLFRWKILLCSSFTGRKHSLSAVWFQHHVPPCNKLVLLLCYFWEMTCPLTKNGDRSIPHTSSLISQPFRDS